ncbi:OPT superfamily oligopeptide transporter [Fistulina hepatica ATCC 64428]|nr:OPT superfamily oligopeptide transporter [Fistulina hepatica ATCC 64428]
MASHASVSEKRDGPTYDEKGGPVDVNALSANLNTVGDDVLEAIEHAKTMPDEEVIERIKYIVERHDDDPNFPQRSSPDTTELFEELKVETALMAINSPYAEVRAVVDNHDDPDEHCLTLRAWIIGIIYVAAGALINQFFDIRQASHCSALIPGIYITSNVAQILAYPAGKLLESVLPENKYNTFGYEWSLNPEHMVVTIMANVGFNTPYTANIVWVQYPERFFNQKWALNFGYQMTTALSTNFIGYSLAGITRRFLVYPYHAIWPTNLATIALNKAFHERNQDRVEGGWKSGMFVYFWFPDYIFTALSQFNWMTWIAPNNIDLAAITGSIGGLGLNPIPTFDWNQLTVVVDPLISPFYATMSTFIGSLLTFPVVAAIWYTNTFYTGYLPINSNRVFDNTGLYYNVSLIVDNEGHFDANSYEAYSPAYLTAGNILLYCFFFAVYTSTLSHAILYHRYEIVHGFKALFRRKALSNLERDVHIHARWRFRRAQNDDRWYFLVLCACVGVGAAGVGAYPTHTSPVVVLYGIFLAIIFCIPVGIIMSVTNVEITLNVLAELFGGLWFQGDALSMNYFKTYGYITTSHTLQFAQDLKLAHYTHIPPRITFTIQGVATVISTFTAMAIVNWQMTSIPDVCAVHQKDNFTCPGINTFFTASVLWGTLGPKKMFGSGAIYSYLLFGFLAGALLPIIGYVLKKKYKVMEYVHVPVLLSGGLIWAPYNLANIWPAVPIAYVFNVFIKKRYLGWWSKYNYITSGAFTSAIAICGIVIFFAIEWPGINLDWWGNNILNEGCDSSGCPRLAIPDINYFGPGVGEFS